MMDYITITECDDIVPSPIKVDKKIFKQETRKGIGFIEIKAYSLNEAETKEDTPFYKCEVDGIYHQYPFGFRTPENCSSGVCRWIYPITYGGGLVGGDQIEATFVIGQRCCVAVCTQEVTKVYHCRDTDQSSSQYFNYKLDGECLLCVLPDPLVCYQDAKFVQKQTFHLEPSSNLVFLDWLLAGRGALGELWSFEKYCSVIEIYLSSKLVLRECNNLDNKSLISLKESMGRYQVSGTCIVLGNQVQSLSKALEDLYGCKKGFGENHSSDLVVSVSSVLYSKEEDFMRGVYIRFLAVDVSAASDLINNISRPLLPRLGADPFEWKL